MSSKVNDLWFWWEEIPGVDALLIFAESISSRLGESLPKLPCVFVGPTELSRKALLKKEVLSTEICMYVLINEDRIPTEISIPC